MKVEFINGLPNVSGDILYMISVSEGNRICKKSREFISSFGMDISFFSKYNFKGKRGDTLFLPSKDVAIVFVGTGKRSEFDFESVRKIVAVGIKEAKNRKFKQIAILDFEFSKQKKELYEALAEGMVLSSYGFEKYKNEKREIEKVMFCSFTDGIKEIFDSGVVKGEAANFTRDIVNEPGNVVTPSFLANVAKDLGKKYGFKVKVFKERELEKHKMVGILTVGKGSKNPPRFIHISYKPENSSKKVVIVGKGVTFDSGGLDIKPAEYMKKMKMDKAGACAVLGIMKAVGEIKPNVEVHALIPAAENMPDGKSYRPDDIIVYKNGKSVEIHNTDAEGRLILADALIYGSELKPDIMIDMATLTGACVVALGNFTSGLFSIDDNLAESLFSISQKSGEKMWRMPLNEDLEDDIKGVQTDIINVGKSRFGGAITAALFLKNFVGKNVKRWAHIDIAGPAFMEKDWKYYGYGATGQPVRTVTEFILNQTDL